MLQQDSPRDFVLATGVAHSVQEFLNAAFEHLGITLRWEGSSDTLTAINPQNSSIVLQLDKGLCRPTEVRHLLGDSTKAKEFLGWKAKIQFQVHNQPSLTSQLLFSTIPPILTAANRSLLGRWLTQKCAVREIYTQHLTRHCLKD